MQREKSPLHPPCDDKRESSRRRLIQLFCDEDSDEETEKSFNDVEVQPDEFQNKTNWVRSRLSQELLESERKYVESLELLVQTFGPLIEARLKEISPALADLIRIIQVISGLNRRFFDELSARMVTWNEQAKIGDVFLAFAPFLRMYCSYATQHQEGTRVLHDLRQKGYTLSKLISGVSAFEWRAGSLESFLILPVQRLPRYQLLFQQLSERTPPDHPDYQNLQNAFRQASSVAFQINEAIRNRENCFKILEIQSRFNGDITLVAPHRRLIRSGTLVKISRSNKQTREFFLFNDMLIYARNATGILHALKINRQIWINSSFEAYDVPSTASRFPFEIRSSVKSFMVLAPSHEDKIDWLLRIMEVADDFRRRTNQQTATPNPADAAPIWQPNNQSNVCSVCSNYFNVLFRRKHHCRKCGNLVCANCSRNRAVNSQAGSLDRICRVCVSQYRGVSSPGSSYAPSNSGQNFQAGTSGEDDLSSTSSFREGSSSFVGDPALQALADEAIATVRRMSHAQSHRSIPEEFRPRAQSVVGTSSKMRKSSVYESIIVEAARSIRRISTTRSRGTASAAFSSDHILYLRAIIPRTISQGAGLHFEIGDLVSVLEVHSGDKCFGVNIRTSRKGYFSLTDMIELGQVEPGQYGCPGVANTAFDAAVYQFGSSLSLKRDDHRSGTAEDSQNGRATYKWSGSYAAIPRNLLTIFVGESVEVIDARSIEWWSGYNSSREFGWFPAEYVTLACSQPTSSVTTNQSCQTCSCGTFVTNVFDSNRCARCQHHLVKHSPLYSCS